MPAITESEEIKRGEELAAALNLRKMPDGRFLTSWGSKSALGLYRTVKRIIDGNGASQFKEKEE